MGVQTIERVVAMKRILAAACVAIVALKSGAAEPASSKRSVPPPGISIAENDRKELEPGVNALAKQIESLRRDLKGRSSLLELLPDVEIYLKAADWALRHDEFYRSNEVQIARALLKQGEERAALLREGRTPWTTATGLVVRGYVSRIDGSVQPYGLVVPASFS